MFSCEKCENHKVLWTDDKKIYSGKISQKKGKKRIIFQLFSGVKHPVQHFDDGQKIWTINLGRQRIKVGRFSKFRFKLKLNELIPLKKSKFSEKNFRPIRSIRVHCPLIDPTI